MKQFATLALATFLALGVPGLSGAAPNGYRTEPINGTDFEVIPRARKDVDGYWCAAADFARASWVPDGIRKSMCCADTGPASRRGGEQRSSFRSSRRRTGRFHNATALCHSGLRRGTACLFRGQTGAAACGYCSIDGETPGSADANHVQDSDIRGRAV